MKSPAAITKVFLASFGPAIIMIGYDMGVGNVSLAANAGSRYGMALLWSLLLTCAATFILLTAHGKYSLVTGESCLASYRKYVPAGNFLALFTLAGCLVTEVFAVMAVMGVITDLSVEWSKFYLTPGGWNPVLTAGGIIAIMIPFLLTGRYSVFEKFLALLVAIMGVSFLLAMFLVVPSPKEMLNGIVPRMPKDRIGILIMVGMVGTTLSAPLFLVRSVLMKEKGWGPDQFKTEVRDSLLASIILFILTAAVMMCATATLLPMGKPVEKAVDMVTTLEPFAGRFAMSIFAVGCVGAGIASIFPICLLPPWLYGDYRGKPVDLTAPSTRIFMASILLTGFVIPALGYKPIMVHLICMVFQPMLMPLVSICILYLINRRDLMKEYKAGFWLNFGVVMSLLFSLIMAAEGMWEIIGYFRERFELEP